MVWTREVLCILHRDAVRLGGHFGGGAREFAEPDPVGLCEVIPLCT